MEPCPMTGTRTVTPTITSSTTSKSIRIGSISLIPKWGISPKSGGTTGWLTILSHNSTSEDKKFGTLRLKKLRQPMEPFLLLAKLVLTAKKKLNRISLSNLERIGTTLWRSSTTLFRLKLPVLPSPFKKPTETWSTASKTSGAASTMIPLWTNTSREWLNGRDKSGRLNLRRPKRMLSLTRSETSAQMSGRNW